MNKLMITAVGLTLLLVQACDVEKQVPEKVKISPSGEIAALFIPTSKSSSVVESFICITELGSARTIGNNKITRIIALVIRPRMHLPQVNQ